MQYLKTNYPCCLHCVWSLGYPATSEIPALYGPALDCAAFEDDFAAHDADRNRELSAAEIRAFLLSREELRNLVLRGALDPLLAFAQATDRRTPTRLPAFLPCFLPINLPTKR